MTYSASEVAKKLKLSKDTLRYYEKEGLIPSIQRNESGHRIYSESDIEWIFLIRCLRDTDMPISKIKQYVALLMNGGETIHERRAILLSHEKYIKRKISAYQKLLKLIGKKVEFYNDALNAENPNDVKCMDYNDEWEHFRTVLGGATYE